MKRRASRWHLVATGGLAATVLCACVVSSSRGEDLTATSPITTSAIDIVDRRYFLEDAVYQAARIALIDILSANEVLVGDQRCAWLVEGRVLESLKGESTGLVKVLVPSRPADSRPVGHQLVMAWRRPPDEVPLSPEVQDYLNSFAYRQEQQTLACRFFHPQTDLFIPVAGLMIWRIDGPKSASDNNRWTVVQEPGQGVFWCDVPREDRRARAADLPLMQGRGEVRIPWPRVRRLIIDALNNPPYTSQSSADGQRQLRDGFRLARCADSASGTD